MVGIPYLLLRPGNSRRTGIFNELVNGIIEKTNCNGVLK